jgi:putative MATE family efflux protein
LNKPEQGFRRRVELLLQKHFTGNSMDYKQVFSMALPVFVDVAFIVLMAMLNTAIISSSGVAAISAVSTVDTLNLFFVSIFVAIATGGSVIVAQCKGSGNVAALYRAVAQAITATTILAVAVSVMVILLQGPTLGLMLGDAEAAVVSNAKLYLLGCCISFPFLAVQQAVVGVLRGVGETKPSLTLSLIMNVTYLVLNVVLVKGIDLGVLGLAISVVVARFIGAAASLVYLARYNQTLHFTIRKLLQFDGSIQKKIMYIGLPFAAEQMFFNGGKIVTQTFIVQFGTFAMTANAIASSIATFLQMGSATLSVVIVTVVGQCIGGKDVSDARKFIRSFLWLNFAISLLFMAIIMPLFPFLMRMYAVPEEIVPTILTLVLILGITQPFIWGHAFLTTAALRAAGDAKFTSVASLISMWLFRIIMGYVFGVTLGFGVVGIWAAMVAEWGVRALIFAWRLRGDKWYKHKLV